MELKWTRFNVQNRQNVKKCTPRQTTSNTFEVSIWTWWEIGNWRNRCCFFPVDIAGYEKWHLVVAIFCSQKNKPQLFCIECSANFVWVFLYELCVSIEFIIFHWLHKATRVSLGILGLQTSVTLQCNGRFPMTQKYVLEQNKTVNVAKFSVNFASCIWLYSKNPNSSSRTVACI